MSRTYISVALRRLVYQRAGGGCEYCRMPEQFSFHPHQVDHVQLLQLNLLERIDERKLLREAEFWSD